MLPAPGDGSDDTDAGLVFLSYSHADALWAQRFGVFLKPLVRGKRLILWDDTQIRATQKWHPAIERAIERSRVALLLVSANFLASDYIMEREMPALLDRGVGLAPVLVGDCLWRQIPELAEVQFLQGGGRDGALALHADHEGELARRMLQACERLLEVVPGPGSGDHPPARSGVAPRPNWEPVVVPDDAVPGPLSRVPSPPPGYVVREELDELVTAVRHTAGDGAVGLTGERTGLGLHGLGGIGKTVLAAAVAADDRVRRWFPDGVFWVTVGEHPDLLALQLDLLARLGARFEARTVPEATQALRTALAEKRVLLVVDDVWSDAAALAFRVTGPQGRLLYTSRDSGVVAAAGATMHRIGVLSPAAARAVAAAVLQVPDDTLPDRADRAFAAVGHVPLAVALLAAAVRSGRDWTEVTAALTRDADVYGTHPYADTFRALKIGVAALPDDLRAALFSLAVFPPDTAIPVAAIARYWAHTSARTTDEADADLKKLAEAGLLRRDGETAGFHDLAHEYLLLHADGLPLLHEQLLGAYRTLLREPDEWWQLPPDEPYIWEHLAGHLAEAGARHALTAVVTDPAYQARRIARDGPQAGEADLALAARVTPDDPVLAWWRAWLSRHAHLLDDTAPNEHRTAATLLAWLTADHGRPADVRLIRLAPLLPRPYLAIDAGVESSPSALVRVLTGTSGRTGRVAWSPDGRQLAAAIGGDIRLWDVATGRLTTTFTTDDNHGPSGLSWTVNSLLLTAHWNAVRQWDPVTGEVSETIRLRRAVSSPVAWSVDRSRLAAVVFDNEVRVYDLTAPQTAVSLTRTGRTEKITAVAWAPHLGHLTTGHVNGAVRRWDLGTGRCAQLEVPHTTEVHALAWSADGNWLASGSQDGSVLLRAAWHNQWTVVADGLGVLGAMAWSPDGRRLAVGGASGVLRVVDPASKRSTNIVTGHTMAIFALDWSGDGEYLASASLDGTVRLWDMTVDDGVATPPERYSELLSVAWSPDGTRLATGADGGAIHLWDPDTGRVAATMAPRGRGWVRAVAWSPDGAHLASGGYDRVPRLWNATIGACVVELPELPSWLTAVAWSPDGTRLAAADDGGRIFVWSVGEQVLLAELHRAESRGINSIAWSPDGVQLVAGGVAVHVWNIDAQRVVASLTGHQDTVHATAWSPAGTHIVTAGHDGTVRLWQPAGTPIAVLDAPGGPVRAVAWSPDGEHIAGGTEAGAVIVWHRDGHELTALNLRSVHGLAWSDTALGVAQWRAPAFLRLRDPADLEKS